MKHGGIDGTATTLYRCQSPMKGSRKATVDVGIIAHPLYIPPHAQPVFKGRLNAVFRFVNISFVSGSLIPIQDSNTFT
jgi:hypothetical protein